MEPLIKTENKMKTPSPKDGSRCNRRTSQTQSVKINEEREGRLAEGREGGWRGLKEGNQRGRGRMGERSSSPLLVGAEGEQRESRGPHLSSACPGAPTGCRPRRAGSGW